MAHKSVAVIAVGLLTMSGGAAFAAEKVTIGNAQIVVKTVTGELEANGEEKRTLELLDDVYHNELIETQESAAAEFVFLDNTKLALGPESSLVLDKFVYDPDPDKASFVATATSGVFRFASGNLPGKTYKINTPTATIGIRGTKFTIVVVPANVDENRSGSIVNVTVEEGIVDLMGCKGKTVSLDRTGPSTTVSMKADGTCVGPSAPGAQPTRFSRLLNRIAVAKE